MGSKITFSMCSNFVITHIRSFILTECVTIATYMLRIKFEQNALNFRHWAYLFLAAILRHRYTRVTSLFTVF